MANKNKELTTGTGLVKKEETKISRRVAFKQIGQVSAAVAAVFLFSKQSGCGYQNWSNYSDWYNYSDWNNWYNWAGKP